MVHTVSLVQSNASCAGAAKQQFPVNNLSIHVHLTGGVGRLLRHGNNSYGAVDSRRLKKGLWLVQQLNFPLLWIALGRITFLNKVRITLG